MDDDQRAFDEIYQLRAKILGVLIRDARLAAQMTPEECAARMGGSVQLLAACEYGQANPSLSEIEMLAYVLEVPVSHFWSHKTISAQTVERQVPTRDYLELRDRVVGAMLRHARKEARLSQEELAHKVGLTVEDIQNYEFGVKPIPFVELTSLASAVDVNLSHFLEDSSRVGAWIELQEEYKQFSELDEELRRFVVKPVNHSYVELAYKLSRMSVEQLRGIAEGILDITY